MIIQFLLSSIRWITVYTMSYRKISAYFHAQWRRQRITELAKDYVILDNVKGKGHYVGTYLALTTLERYWWGEGEVKFYIDGDDEYPTICGTGTEDYFGGSWSFAHQVNGKTVEQTYNSPFWDTLIIPHMMNSCITHIIMMIAHRCEAFIVGI